MRAQSHPTVPAMSTENSTTLRIGARSSTTARSAALSRASVQCWLRRLRRAGRGKVHQIVDESRLEPDRHLQAATDGRQIRFRGTRYCGEEFVVVLLACDSAAAMRIAASQRAAVEGLGIQSPSKKLCTRDCLDPPRMHVPTPGWARRPPFSPCRRCVIPSESFWPQHGSWTPRNSPMGERTMRP